MTREEAIVYFESLLKRFEEIRETETSYWGKVHTETTIEATRVAISALRPVSREQVEKVWRGCEKCNGAGEYSRYAENLTKILLAKYCPHCGRPLTDEAVQMVMERMDALHDTEN